MSARVICFASAKGGSGKTVITASIGTFLAAVGKKVLLVDTDAATNGLTLLYLKEVMLQADKARSDKREPFGLYDGLSRNSLEFVTVPGGAHLLPASYNFTNTEDKSFDEYTQSLSHVVSVARESYDVVLLDAQAGSDVYAKQAMSRAISDTVVIMAEYDPLSAAGVERLKGLMPQDLTYERTWILLNKVLPEFTKNFSDFLEVVRYLSPIPWDSQVVRAYARRRLAIDVENGNAFTLAIMQVTKVLFNGLEKEIDNWASSRADMIRRPIDEQYQDLEKEFGSIIVASEKLTDRLNRRKRLVLVLNAAMVTMIISGAILGISGIQDMLFIPDLLKDSGLLKNVSPVVVVILVMVVSGALVSFTGGIFKVSPETEIEKSKLDRRRAVIEEQLRRLETLRSASLETLVRSTSPMA